MLEGAIYVNYMNTNRPPLWKRGMALLSLLTAVLVVCSSCNRPPYPSAAQRGTEIVIDISTLEPDIPSFRSYPYQGKNINYFVLKIDDKVNSFLDACSNCYIHKKGYHVENGSVTCRNCGVKLPVSNLGKGLGSCFPIRIEGRLEKDEYHIPVKLLEAAADKF